MVGYCDDTVAKVLTGDKEYNNVLGNILLGLRMFLYATVPDPFRFYPARHSRFWAPYFQWINRTLLNHQFKMPKTLMLCQPGAEFSRTTLANLQHPTMVVCNHINFADPQVVLEQAQIAKTPLWWMAGIEPFERLRGVQTFHLSNCGTFSLDRGVIDRNALLTAQRVLDEGKYPLVIFAEGEADYTQDVTSPYFEGGASFALKTLKNSKLDVMVIPVHLSYHFSGSTSDIFHKVWQQVDNLAVQYGLPLPRVQTSAEVLAQMPAIHHNVLGGVVSLLTQRYGVEFIPAGSVALDVRSLLTVVFRQLCTEHEVPFNPDDVKDYAKVMALKNRLRSIIVRKCRAMKKSQFDETFNHLEKWKVAFDKRGLLSCFERGALVQTEKSLVGFANEHLPWDKRLKALEKHLKAMAPYVNSRHQAREDDQQRWQQQLGMCRELKLLKILQRDLETDWRTIEQLDEWRFKLTLLLAGKSRYLGPKHARMVVGKPQSLRQAIDGCDEPATPALLTEWFKNWVTGLNPSP